MTASELSRLQTYLPANAEITPKWRYMLLPMQTGGIAPNYVGGGVGDPVFTEIGSTGQFGLRIQAANDTHCWVVPFGDDVDVEKGIEFSVLWSSDQTTTADEYLWQILYDELTLDETAVAAGATALSTAIATDANIGTANAIQQTAWGVLNGGTLSGRFSDGYLHAITLKAQTMGGTVDADAVLVYGIVIRYKPRKV